MKLLRWRKALLNVPYRYMSVVSGDAPQVQQPLNFVGGRRVEPAPTLGDLDLTAPATGKTLRSVKNTDSSDVDAAVTAAQDAFKIWSKMSGVERGAILRKTASLLRDRAELLARTEVLDTGKPIWEARYDIQSCTDTIEYYGGLAAKIAGEFQQLSNGSFAYTIKEPLGVVGGIGAWNFPFQMAAWKSSPALAAGNSIVFKPSQFTPLTAVMLGEIYTEAGLPPGCYNVIQGGAKTGELLSNHEGIAKMSFTGSVETGSKIMQACAKQIHHVTLELGGKSPCIVFEDCDIDKAVTGAMLANFLNQGQVCSNGTRVFVQESIMESFLDKLVSRTKAMKIGDPNEEDTTVGATITPQQAQKTLSYIDIAKEEGASVLYGGDRVIPSPELSGGHYLRPCILVNCNDNMRVVREEVFGSVMSVLSFKSEDEVIHRANDSEFGLAGGVFTNNLQRAHKVVSGLEAGSLYVNTYNVYPVGVPFGGYKKSGIGRENGPDTLDYYTQVKSVYVEMGPVEAPF